MTSKKKELELYIHIPFCVKKCLYCDFLSGPAEENRKTAYMEALRTEIEERAEELSTYRVVSVFVGGGTPSVAEAGQLARLLCVVRERYRLAEDAEITVEVNPGTVDREKLAIYRKAGVNRLSIGLQSADDRELAAIGRIHTVEQFEEAYAAAVAAGFDNINVDVMSALPGQSREAYLRTLDYVLKLKPRPAHISAYSLILEEGTPLYEKVRAGEIQPVDEETDRLMYGDTKRILKTAGYERYEISNYAMPGKECRHNCGYWTRRNYAGFGIGAASMLENERFQNSGDMERYLIQPLGCREERKQLTQQEQEEEFMFLGLRLTRGVSTAEFRAEFGRGLEEVYGDVIGKNLKDGLLTWLEGGSRLALTERGLDLANYVMAQFLM
ncbi:MAG: radical SAM family heme chaperone HemW [Acetatifactor sp.]